MRKKFAVSFISSCFWILQKIGALVLIVLVTNTDSSLI